ncbi:DUF6907 domain-containing protein [Streptomyces sp. NPDC006477]|uniref:DUF6907 domain-containing protein n=1 Tax=Streptomyces sp. NPDC006477 TaxID=3364747 RepID=UPI0036783CD4
MSMTVPSSFKPSGGVILPSVPPASIPPLDLTRTGRVPAALADEPSPAEEAARMAKLIATRVLGKTPALAAQISTDEFAEIVQQSLRKCVDQCKPTAAERGPAWIARYACPDWCVLDHTAERGAPGWHQGPAFTADAPAHQDRPGETPGAALAARITHLNDDPEAFGTKTQLWLDVDCETYEMDLAETDRFIERLEHFLPRLHRLRNQLAEISKDDRPEDSVAVAARHAEWQARLDADRAARVAAEVTE